MSAALSLLRDPNARPPQVIDRFTGEHGWLSNFGPGEASYDGDLYPTREHAFNAAKTLDPQARADIAAAPTPGEAKRIGRQVDLRVGWDGRVRYEAMWEVLATAFNSPDLAGRLEATGTALLIEGNTHHDRHWGTCHCLEHQEIVGANHLGRTLMAIRSTRREDPPNTWTRAALVGQPAVLTPEQTAWVADELRRVYGKLRQHNGITAVLTGAAGLIDVQGAELAQRQGIGVWVYLPAPDHTAQLPPVGDLPARAAPGPGAAHRGAHLPPDRRPTRTGRRPAGQGGDLGAAGQRGADQHPRPIPDHRQSRSGRRAGQDHRSAGHHRRPDRPGCHHRPPLKAEIPMPIFPMIEPAAPPERDLVDQLAVIIDPYAFQPGRLWIASFIDSTPEQIRNGEQGTARDKARAILALLGHPVPTPSPAPTTDTSSATAVNACRTCGCTDEDCSQCFARTGTPCWWVEADLCSACAG